MGSGLMGAGIATAHARSGIPTAMVDISEERLADVEPVPSGRIADVLVDRERAVDEAQELVCVDAKAAALAARDRNVQEPQELVHAAAEVDLG